MKGKSSREIGLVLNVSHTAINKAARAGRIPKLADGSFDLKAVKKVWERNADQHQRQRGTAAKRRPVEAGPIVTVASAEGEAETGKTDFLEAQRRREWLRVAKEELELDLKRGKLLAAEDVEKEWSSMVASARNRILLMAAKLAPKMAACADVRQCQAMIEKEIKEALKALSEEEREVA